MTRARGSPGFVVNVVAPAAALASALLFSLAEAGRPLRGRTRTRRQRYPTNAVLAATAALAVRGVVMPAIAAAAWASPPREAKRRSESRCARAASFLALDYTMYLWHRLNHVVPWLWRWHAVHHADRDLDASTAFRFHFGELLASAPMRALQTLVVGESWRDALAYDMCMQLATAFHHANWRLPGALETKLAWVFVTPRMHGIHHSAQPRHQNANWSVIFSFWDRLHGTHVTNAPQSELRMGLGHDNQPPAEHALGLLLAPFRARDIERHVP